MKTQPLDQLDSVTEEIGEAVVVRLLGQATGATLDYLEDQLRALLEARPAKVVIVGNELTELSAAAVVALVRFRRNLAGIGGEARLVELPL